MNLHTISILFGCIFVGVYTDEAPKSTLITQASWQYLEYDFDSDKQKSDFISSGNYVLENNVPIDVEVTANGKTFITVRRVEGTPASLLTITNRTGNGGGPLLRPYPNWNWTNTSNCDNLVAVYRTALDQCNRLWVLDTGKVGDNLVCPAKLLAFDLSNDTLVQRVNIPKELSTNANGVGLLLTPVIDTVGTDCGEIKIYMADTYGNGLVIWDGQNTWRIESPYFKPDPSATHFSVHGTEFEYARGLFALSITPDEQNEENREIYFRALSSYNIYRTKLVELDLKKNEQSSIEYFIEPTELPSQSVVQAFSSEGILFFSGTTEMSILCWNRHKPFVPENIVTVAQDAETLQWASGIKIYTGDTSETLWVLTNRWQDFYTNKMNFTGRNFGVFSGSVNDLVRGTNCSSNM